MSDHPDYPQDYEKTPALRYIVEQVSRIEDAHVCGVGYYKSVGQILQRLDKTDQVLSQLHQTTFALKAVTDSKVVATVLGKKSDEINETLRENTNAILEGNVKAVSSSLAKIEYNNEELNKGFVRVMNEISGTNTKLDNQIASVKNGLVIPTWTAWMIVIFTLIVGFLLGRFTL